MMFRKILAFGLTLVLTACGIQTAPRLTPTPITGTPCPVLIDTDMAGDDWMAILYLLNRPDVSVIAITVSGTGEAHCEPGIKNAMSSGCFGWTTGTSGQLWACNSPARGSCVSTGLACKCGCVSRTYPSDNPTSPVTNPLRSCLQPKSNQCPGKVTTHNVARAQIGRALQFAPELKGLIQTHLHHGWRGGCPGNVGISGAGIDIQWRSGIFISTRVKPGHRPAIRSAGNPRPAGRNQSRSISLPRNFTIVSG